MFSFTLMGLFLSAFVSATLAPGGSEVLLAYLVNQGQWAISVLIITATVGNTLGSLTSYVLGRFIQQQKQPQDFIKGRESRALVWIEKYGVWALLLAWLPIVGDVLPLLAGWFKLSFWQSCTLIFIGKFLRYSLIALATLGIFSFI